MVLLNCSSKAGLENSSHILQTHSCCVKESFGLLVLFVVILILAFCCFLFNLVRILPWAWFKQHALKVPAILPPVIVFKDENLHRHCVMLALQCSLEFLEIYCGEISFLNYVVSHALDNFRFNKLFLIDEYFFTWYLYIYLECCLIIHLAVLLIDSMQEVDSILPPRHHMLCFHRRVKPANWFQIGHLKIEGPSLRLSFFPILGVIFPRPPISSIGQSIESHTVLLKSSIGEFVCSFEEYTIQFKNLAYFVMGSYIFFFLIVFRVRLFLSRVIIYLFTLKFLFFLFFMIFLWVWLLLIKSDFFKPML